MATFQTARWIPRGDSVFVLLVLTISLLSSVIHFRYRSKGKDLPRDVKTLRMGQATTADVKQIMNRHFVDRARGGHL